MRELKNTIENMFVLSSRDYLQIQDLPWRRDREQEPIKHEQTAVQSLDEAVADFERRCCNRPDSVVVLHAKWRQS